MARKTAAHKAAEAAADNKSREEQNKPLYTAEEARIEALQLNTAKIDSVEEMTFTYNGKEIVLPANPDKQPKDKAAVTGWVLKNIIKSSYRDAQKILLNTGGVRTLLSFGFPSIVLIKLIQILAREIDLKSTVDKDGHVTMPSIKKDRQQCMSACAGHLA